MCVCDDNNDDDDDDEVNSFKFSMNEYYNHRICVCVCVSLGHLNQ